MRFNDWKASAQDRDPDGYRGAARPWLTVVREAIDEADKAIAAAHDSAAAGDEILSSLGIAPGTGAALAAVAAAAGARWRGGETTGVKCRALSGSEWYDQQAFRALNQVWLEMRVKEIQPCVDSRLSAR